MAKGCSGLAAGVFERGPDGHRVQIDRCPARFVGGDVIDFVDSLYASGRRVSLSEQDLMTPIEFEAMMVALPNMEAHEAHIIGNGRSR